MTRRVRFRDVLHPEGNEGECTLAEYLADNATDTDACADVEALAVGETVRLYYGGGGAVDVTRIE